MIGASIIVSWFSYYRHPDVGGAGGAMAPPLFCQNIIRRNVKISLVITDYRFKSRIA